MFTLCQKRTFCTAVETLFDHLISDGVSLMAPLDAERPRRLQVSAGINADLTMHVRDVGSVAHQPANGYHLTLWISRWNLVARRKGANCTARLTMNASGATKRASERSGAKLAKAVIAHHLPTNIGM